MCGIAGIVGPNNLHNNLQSMVRKIAHRGPDDLGTWSTDRVSLGHVRLKIIDMSAKGLQPMCDTETGNVLIFNGEIYNYLELKNLLKNEYNFQSRTDTEVILAAYRKWGVECVNYLRGMFAFAIWDEKQKLLFLSRDRVGIKPLYFREGPDYFLFASEIKALLDFSNLTYSPHEESIFKFLVTSQLDTNENTFFSEVKQLLPGTTVCIQRNGRRLKAKSYWSLSPPGNLQINPSSKSQFKDLFQDTLQLHLRADVNIGAFVSGGIDSSSIACLAASILPPNSLNTFSAILPEKNEENALIPDVQSQISGINHEILLNGQNFLNDLPKLIYHHDEPVADGSMYAHFLLCQLASEHGIKVLLSGNGGDEIFGGYNSHVYSLLGHFLRQGKINELKKYIKCFNVHRNESKVHLLIRSLQEATPVILRNLFKRNQINRQGKHTNLKKYVSSFDFYCFKNIDPFYMNYVNNLNHWTVPSYLHYEDRNSMAFGVEVRVPFLDHKLIEFVSQFTPESLLNGQTKLLLRESMVGITPDSVLRQRKKYGFPAPLNRFLINNRDQIIELCKDALRDVPFLNYENSLSLCLDYIRLNKGDLTLAWRTIAVALWYKIFFKNQYYPWRQSI